LNINCEGNAGLFDQFAGTLTNLNIHGNIQGTQYVGAFGGQIHGGSVKSCGSYATVTCSAKSGSSSVVGAGGFFGCGQLDNEINFHSCVSQGNVLCSGSTVANTACGYVGCLLSQQSSASNFLNFDTCLSVPLSLQAQYCDAYAKSLVGTSQVCSGESCATNLKCQTCYYNEFAGDCACSASQVPNEELCCPQVLCANDIIFHYTCSGSHFDSSSPSSSGSNTIHPIFPASPGSCSGSSVKPCTKDCIYGTHCVNDNCVPGPKPLIHVASK